MKFETKNEYRNYALAKRKELDIKAISEQIVQIINEQSFFVNSKNILSYAPFRNEIDLFSLKKIEKNWHLPRVEYKTRKMIIHKYKIGDNLLENKWGIKEPCTNIEIIEPEKLDLVLLPALMADKNFNRLGYGGGFYDRLLPKLRTDCIKVLPVAKELIVDKLPVEKYDMTVDIIVTQYGLI